MSEQDIIEDGDRAVDVIALICSQMPDPIKAAQLAHEAVLSKLKALGK